MTGFKMFSTSISAIAKCLAILAVGHFALRGTPTFYEIVILYSVFELTSSFIVYKKTPIIVNIDSQELTELLFLEIKKHNDRESENAHTINIPRTEANKH